MKHDAYSLTELIRNDDFIAWVLHPDAESDIQWQLFLANNPGKKKTVESAREYVILLAKDTGRNVPAPQQSEKMWKMVESTMQEEAKQAELEMPVDSHWRWVRVAASAALILSIGSVSYWFYYKSTDAGRMHNLAVTQTEQSEGFVQKYNDTQKPMTVILPDGSSVVLQPGAHLSFTKVSKRNRREVTLTGKAFFEITKDKEKPFLVYSYGLATKVLGTSFLIDASESNDDIKVEVKTGTVSVFSINNMSDEMKGGSKDSKYEEVTLNKDEKIAFSRDNGKILKLEQGIPLVLNVRDVSRQNFFFDETPVSQVFEAMEAAYNVKITYDKELVGNCSLNATLVGQPFSKKLEVICNALGVQYEIRENQVTITGNGCK
ncbi:FecR family protein [Dyadobacter sp. CY312]|uniref:FecR family protein n=1 Tax=Dyadobacter sp. CY312 TaxID=2907303 RepID=UPI001F3E5655|nr:FecR family protein [Dyadobacter sp. CY312]MCE7043472.1 FecR family protein [Dyadobacter sp. CY312]